MSENYYLGSCFNFVFSSFQSQGCRGFELGLPEIDESVFERQEDDLTGEDYADVDDGQ